MRKLLCLSIALLLVTSITFSQQIIPNYFDYSVQLKDGNKILRNTRLTLKVTIKSNNQEVYQEEHPSIYPNYDGFVQLQVGLGNRIKGVWEDINWQKGREIIKVEGRVFGTTANTNQVLSEKYMPVTLAQTANNIVWGSDIIFRPDEEDPYSSSITIGDDKNPYIQLVDDNGDNTPYIDFQLDKDTDGGRLKLETDSTFVVQGFEKLYLTSPKFIRHESKEHQIYGGPVTFKPNLSNVEESYITIADFGSPYIELVNKGTPTDVHMDFSQSSDQDYGGRLWLKPNNDFLIVGEKNLVYEAPKQHFYGELYIHRVPDMDVSAVGKKFASLAYNGNDNVTGTNPGNKGGARYSLRADDRILAVEFNAVSDARIKKNVKNSTSKFDLDILNHLLVRDFLYVDSIHKGEHSKKGFIAQEVEKVFPEAVSKTTDFIPNIYRFSDKVKYNNSNQTLTITLDSLSGLTKGEIVRIIADEIYELEIENSGQNTVTVKGWTGNHSKGVFVYGKKVDDFRVVDYDQIFTLNVSATQALIQQVEALQAEVAELKQGNEQLKSENVQLQQSFDKLTGRLDALEQFVKVGNSSSSKTSSSNK